MTLQQSREPELGEAAPDFRLPGVDGKTWTLAECSGPNGTLVMFICCHCPYVTAIRERLVPDMRELQSVGIGVVAISANDAQRYPDDSFANMQRQSREWGFGFPYLYDESQDVARAYGAVCTPDFFGYDGSRRLAYRGRLDAAQRGPRDPGMRRDLVEAMLAVAAARAPSAEQFSSMGCSIKWKY